MATALATAAAGLAAHLGLWRLAFAAPAVAAGVLGLVLARRLPEPPKGRGGAGPLARIGLVARRPWAVLVVLLALVEGGVILGFLTYLAPSLEAQGYSAAVSGLAVALYGLATLAWTQALKKAADRLDRHALILIGGAFLASGYAAGALDLRSWAPTSRPCWSRAGSPSCTLRCRPGPRRSCRRRGPP